MSKNAEGNLSYAFNRKDMFPFFFSLSMDLNVKVTVSECEPWGRGLQGLTEL